MTSDDIDKSFVEMGRRIERILQADALGATDALLVQYNATDAKVEFVAALAARLSLLWHFHGSDRGWRKGDPARAIEFIPEQGGPA
ncbi:hypothetical protein [Burkholderia gladioli]|uniref:hypothetical protein n=1 Tax=Burkholderia gladioli TaxID=28095 RepID=UPI0016418515|nr:hypothetical protein [Burkholderia gladioli]